MPETFDRPQDQPRTEDAFKPSGEDNSVRQYWANRPDVKQRIQTFDQESIAFAPDAVGHVVTQLPGKDENAGFIGELMSDVVPWIQETTKFADVPGQLMRARIQAMQIPDPEERAKALAFLRHIQSLPTEDQWNLMLYIRGGSRGAGRGAALFGSAQARALAEAINVGSVGGPVRPQDLIGVAGADTPEEYFAEYGTAESRGAPGEVFVSNEEYLSTLKALFPNLPAELPDRGVIEAVGTDTGEWILGYESVQQTAEILDEIYEEAKAGKKKGLAERGSEFLRVFGGIAGSMGDVGFDIAGNVGRRIPFVGEAASDFTGRQAKAAENAISKAIQPVLTYGMDPIGKDPNTGEPVFSLEDQKVIQERAGGFILIAGIGGQLTGSALGKAGRRVKTAATAAGKDVAKAALESTRSIRRGGILGAAAETYRLPVRKITEIIDKALVLFARDPEKFFASGIRKGQGQKLLDALDLARKAHPGSGQEALDGQVGFIRQIYGDQVNDRLARQMLKQTTREGEMRVFVDTLTNPEAGTRVISRIQKTRAKVAARLRELEDPATVNSRPQRLAEAAARMEDLKAQNIPGAELPDNWLGQVRSALEEYRLIKGEEHEISRLRAQEIGLDWQVKTTFDDTPMLRYPKQNIIRAAVRGAPTTRLSRLMYGMFVRNAKILDPAKFVDDLPRYPELHVHGTTNAPPNAAQLNANTLSTYMRRAGVPSRIIEQHIGALAEVKTRTQFYDLVENKIFGEGGAIDNALHPKVDPQLRNSIINLHDSPVEARTFSVVSEKVDTPHGTSRISRPVLGVEKAPGDFTPIPSRPTEFLNTLRLPDIGLIIEADSAISRGLRALERSSKIGAGAHHLISRYPKFILGLSTGILKPLVMLVRLPAMMMRIQLEQSLRIANLGYKPLKGLPDGLTLFPGGIPIPLTRGVRIAKSMFGEDGWKLLDPDPRMVGFSAPDSSDMGMFLSEMMDDAPVERVVETTLDFRAGRRTPKTVHWESFRKELEQANADFVDRKLASLDLDADEFIKWLDRDPTAKRYMDLEQRPELERAYPSGGKKGVEDGAVIQIPARDLIQHLEFPNRAILADEVGRTPQQITDLRASLAQLGYDPDFVPPGATEPVGPLRMEFNPLTGEALVREGHHRIGVAAELDQTVPVRIERVEGFEATVGADIEEVSAAGALRGLSDLNQGQRLTDLRRISEDILPRDRPAVADPIRTWVDSRIAYLRQLTKDNPKYLDTIATGKSRSLSRIGHDFGSDGRNIAAKHDELVERLDIINSTLREKLAERAPGYEVAALQNERKLALRAVERLRRESPALLEGTKTFKLSDKRRWRDHVKEEWAQGRMELPDRLLVEKRVRGYHQDGGILDDHEKYSQGLTNALYKPFALLSYADEHGTRGSLFTQVYKREQFRYRARGLDPKTADAMAYARAGEKTRDIMYDLTARSSVHRSLKDIMWFAPAYQEVLYTWLVKIPSEAYWPIGATSLALKGAGFIDMLSATGVLRENAEGEKVIIIPGLSKFIEAVTGKKVPEVVYGKLGGLNLVSTGGGVPGLSTAGNFALGQAALRWGGVFKSLSDVFQPYGPESSLLPQPITFLTEALTGAPPAFEALSPDRLKADWDRSFDLGIQYAWNELSTEGREIPRPEAFGKDQEGYEKANRAYINELMDLAGRYAQGIAWVRAVGSTVAPMSLYATSEERQEWENFWNKIIVPEGFGDQGMSDRQRDLIDGYLEDHPNSMAFSVFYRGQGEKVRDLPFPEDIDDAFYDDYYTGASRTLSPKEFSLKLMATESRRYYQAQLDVVLNEISPTRDPWELLTHGSEKKDALTDYYQAWDRWKFLNPEAEALLLEQSALWRRNHNVPLESFEVERISEALRLSREIAPMLTGEEGIRPDAVRDFQTQLGILFSEKYEGGAPTTASEKALDWWFDKVFNPYIDKTTPLYDEAQRLESQGLPTSHIWNQIRDIQNSGSYKYKGEVVPSVEAMFFGNKNQEERQAAVLSWRSRPLSWLSDFQLEKSGYTTSPRVKGFLDSVSKYDEKMWNYIRDNNISFSSKEYDQLKASRLSILGAQAEKLGPDVARIWALNEAAPYVRLNDKGFGFIVPQWRDISSAVNTITERIVSEGLSPKSFSELAVDQKIFLYTALGKSREENPILDSLFTQLSYSFPLPGGGYREGASLYEAVFFGNFNTDYIPFDVASAAQVAA